MPKEERPGYELPFLLIDAFRSVVEELHRRLESEGHPEARPAHGFALQAIGGEGASISVIAGRLGVSKQAAAKSIASLESLGYAVREGDPEDGRAVRVRRTDRGEDLLARSARAFEEIRTEWAKRLGRDRFRQVEDALSAIGAKASDRSAISFPASLR